MGMIDKPTPMSTQTRAALSEIERRVGTHGAFRAAMMRGLRSRHRPGLQGMQTQSDEDWTIAFLDAWAGVLDGLTFYNERIINEAYLQTATETFSVQELAALVGYSLSPAVAAEAWMAFIGDESVLETGVIEFDAGLQIKSVPEEGELPQTFETVDPLRVKSAWNAIHPVRHWPQNLVASQSGFYADLSQNALRVGDKMVFADEGGAPVIVSGAGNPIETLYLRTVSDVVRISDRVAWVETVADSPLEAKPVISDAKLPEPSMFDDLNSSSLDGMLSALAVKQWSRPQVLEAAAALEVSSHDLAQTLAKIPRVAAPLTPIVFREKCRVFGHNAVSRPKIKASADQSLLPYEAQTIPSPSTLYYQYNAIVDPETAYAEAPAGPAWPDFKMSILLDRKYESIVPGSLVLLRGVLRLYQTGGWYELSEPVESWLVVDDVTTVSVEAFGLSGEVTRIRVPVNWGSFPAQIITVRSAELYVAGEDVTLPDLAIEEPVSGAELLLDTPDLDFAPGQSVILTGERADMPGVTQSERLTIDKVWVNASTLRLVFATPMVGTYVRDSVVLNGNVARATHGEATHQILGSGDGRVAFQRFALKGAPLTYVSADTPTGRLAALEVRVDGVRWAQVPSLDDAGPEDRVYTVLTREDGSSEVMFGGQGMGVRLPTGENNVEAYYRKGAGAAGRLKAGQLSQLVSKPRSLKSVSNPLAASGGAAAERLEDARQNTPKGLLTLGRVVSLQDYEVFARGFSGLSKAKAAWSWRGEDQHVFLTVAGETGAPLSQDDTVITSLTSSVLKVSAPGTGLTVRPARVAYFTLKAKVLVDADYRAVDGSPDPVLNAARRVLRDAYAFEARAIGQPVRASDAITLLQSVPGVLAVDLDLLHRTDGDVERLEILRADVPRTGGQDALLGAEILLLGVDPVTLEVMSDVG